MLFQELIREKRLSLDDGMPLVVTNVHYNGESRWGAANDLASLLCESPEGTEQFRPQHRYLLIDESGYDDRELAESRNLVATLLRLEHGCPPDQIRGVASALM